MSPPSPRDTFQSLNQTFEEYLHFHDLIKFKVSCIFFLPLNFLLLPTEQQQRIHLRKEKERSILRGEGVEITIGHRWKER